MRPSSTYIVQTKHTKKGQSGHPAMAHTPRTHLIVPIHIHSWVCSQCLNGLDVVLCHGPVESIPLHGLHRVQRGGPQNDSVAQAKEAPPRSFPTQGALHQSCLALSARRPTALPPPRCGPAPPRLSTGWSRASAGHINAQIGKHHHETPPQQSRRRGTSHILKIDVRSQRGESRHDVGVVV